MRRLTVGLMALAVMVPFCVGAAELTDNRKRTTGTTINARPGVAAAYGSQIATSPTDPTDLVEYIQEQAAAAGSSYTFGQEAADIPESPSTGDYFEANANIDLQVGHDPDFFEEDGTTQEQVLPRGHIYQYNGTAWILVAETGTNLSTTIGSSVIVVRSTTGTDTNLPPATVNTAGLMTASHRAKFDRIEDGADITDRANVYAQVKDIIEQGSNVSVTDNDSAETVTIASVGGGGGGLTAVTSDSTLTGDGTSGSPLGVANNAIGQNQMADNAIGVQEMRDQSVGLTELRTDVTPRLLPSGGANDECLTKSSSTDYAVDWSTCGTGTGTTNLGINRGSSSVEITSSSGDNVTIPAASTSQAGVMRAVQVAKLDSIEGNAQVADADNIYPIVKQVMVQGTNVTITADDTAQTLTVNSSGGGGGGTTNLGIANRDADSIDITSSSGTDATIPSATTSLAGLLSAADKTTLDGADDAFDSVSFANSTLRLNFGHVGGGTSGVPLTILREFQGADLSSQTTFGKGDYTQVGTNLYMATATSTTLTNPATQIPGHANFVRLGLVYADGTSISGDGRSASSALAVPDGGISSAKLATDVSLRGDPTAPTPSSGDNDTSVATTAFVTAAIAAGTPSQDHTNRAAVSTDTNLSLTEYNAGTTSATDSITIPTWTGSRYVFIGTPEDEDSITGILSGGINIISSWTCSDTVVHGHKWCRTSDIQNDVISGATYQVVQ